jgi:ABC-2 type transport system ATP-binding protein
MSPTDIAIEAENLVKIYHVKSARPVRALDGLSLSVKQGEIFGLLGENGAGKTTLLRILTTLLHPTTGRATLMGLDVERRAYDVRKKICAVLQENAVEVFLSVEDNLTTYARFHSIPRREIGATAERVIEQFALGEFRKQKVIDLSGGLKRRVQVAKVFMVDKPVVFLDEATTGMDPTAPLRHRTGQGICLGRTERGPGGGIQLVLPGRGSRNGEFRYSHQHLLHRVFPPYVRVEPLLSA